MRIAILEDDLPLARYVEKSLVESGSSCEIYTDGLKLVQQLQCETYDVLILDWNLPGMSGIAILEWLSHSSFTKPPVLMLTSRSAEADIVAGLLAGADDYVVKPVSPAVLVARVAAIARRAYPEAARTTETFGPYQLDRQSDVILLRDVPITLTAKEYTLAVLLFRNLNRPLSRSYLLETIWGVRPDLLTRTLDAHISNVRAKLNLRPENGFKLASIYSYGYRLEDLT